MAINLAGGLHRFHAQLPKGHEQTELLEIQADSIDRLVRLQPLLGVALFRALAQTLAGRLAANNDELKKTLAWVMGNIE
ncbi:MAG: hypothetical protein HY343_08565 [Lentisphaerae bacterium]|nr:hypothetical protein [Lentisphaerota bacterium]